MHKIALLTLVFLSICSCATKEVQPTSSLIKYAEDDQRFIDFLIKNGSDPSKEHWVTFLVNCNTEKQISEILSKAKMEGFDDGYISYAETPKLWSSSLSATMKLNLNEVSASRAKLMPLIPMNSCDRVGWGAAVVK